MNNPLKILRTLDLGDIQFLLQREPLSEATLRAAFIRARVPDVPEIRELFKKAQPKVLDAIQKS